jgi:hypothetical protein
MSKLSNSVYLIRPARFDNESHIERRVASLPEAIQGSVRSALRYLYLTDGPRNLPRPRRKIAEPYLDRAERIVVRWLQRRTNGQYRRTYGFRALQCARLARYRCEECGEGDVRVLEFDHVEGRVAHSRFACLCANCHKIKTRKWDWI